LRKLLVFCVVSVLLFSCKEKPKKASEKIISIEFSEYKGQLSNGQIKRIDSFPSKYVRPRNVDVWLPDSYNSESTYAVLYMHDGQMLFDSTQTWNNQEWKVDETVASLMAQNKIKNTIVVAIWNHADIRHSDYFPKKPFESLGEKFKDSIINNVKRGTEPIFAEEINSDNYLKFLVGELKPVIDANFSTLKGPDNTVVMGSSMGGLISMYAINEYPKVFVAAGCLSTHWIGIWTSENNPIPEAFFSYMSQNLPAPETHKLYFDYGTETLDASYISYQYRVDEVLKTKGYTELNYRNLKFEGAGHSENSWNKRLAVPLEFLLKK